jgi:hypothetical protein
MNMNGNTNTYYTLEPLTIDIQDNPNNKKILDDAGIHTNWKYRQYMQKNANQIMKYDTMQAIYSSGNNPYTLFNNEPTNNTPFLYNSLYDTNNPQYGFTNSDLKQDYLTKEKMKSRMIAPSISLDKNR